MFEKTPRDRLETETFETETTTLVLYPLQHSIGYMGDGFYRSKDPTNSIKVLKQATKENANKAENIIHTEIRNRTR